MQQRFYSAHHSIVSLLLCLTLTGVLFIPSGCKSKVDDPEPISNVQLAKLSKTWKIKNVTLDGISKISEYPSFQLTLAGTKGADSFSYTTNARPSRSPWPANGKWAFGSDIVTQIKRDPNTTEAIEITYSVQEGVLKLNFNFAGAGYTGRVAELTGQWIFTFE